MGRLHIRKKGISLAEVLLAAATFSLFMMVISSALIYGRESTALSGNRERAIKLAEEGLEATRNIRDSVAFASFNNVTDYGLSNSEGSWSLVSIPDVTEGIYTRKITIASVDGSTKKITVTVTWNQFGSRSGAVSISSYLTAWREPGSVPTPARGGILVYGNGGTTSDSIKYRVLDSNNGTWSSGLDAADIDTGSTNRALRSVQTYASKSRNEKIIISRHYNGSTQYIYSQVFNGTTWGNVNLLSSWNAATFLDVQNFSGTYLLNGDFMAVYSDNTTTPKYKIWNGISWSGQNSLNNLANNGSGIPNYIIARARPGTNEVMVATFDQSRDTNTQYYNGSGYVLSSWDLHARHAQNAPSNTRKIIDFEWSQFDSNIGMVIYSTSTNDKTITGKIWTANGSGGGAWSSARSTSNMTSNMGILDIVSTAGKQEFVACNKDLNTSPRIQCFKSDFTPTWTTPSNNLIVTGTDNGIQRSYHMGAPRTTGKFPIIVYSDTTNIPKLKKYDTNATSWDTTSTNINSIVSALETVRIIPSPLNDDLMILMGNTNQDVYSVVWDANTNSFYSTPAGKAFSSHGISGSSDEDFWFDFAWDKHSM